MNVGVLAVVVVLVSVKIFVYMSMLVLMRLVAIRPPEAPDEIDESERNEQPCRQVAAIAFNDLQPVDGDSK